MSLVDLQCLKDAWEKEYPKQAHGGDVAVSGFAFQFLEVLLASVRAWLKQDVANRGTAHVFGELLSDIAEVRSDGVLVVTQVKYTQSSGMVTSALGDLFRIYCVAAAHTPGIVGKLDLRVLSARSGLKSVAGTISRWQPESISSTDPRLADFRARVRAEVHEDPEDELLALLANEFRAEHPLATVQGWIGRLTTAAGAGKGYAAVAQDIWDDLVALERARAKQRPAITYVWTAADRPPAEVAQGRVLTGQQPQVHHLREGFFASRTELYTTIADHVTSWIGASHSGQDDSLRLPLYWIGGRSGAGKSVALLHVLALLHERGIATVLFPPSVSHLPATIRWSREMRRPGCPVVIALDDPYTPAAQGDAASVWRNALDELHELRQSGESLSMPLLVCCGPTEQAERLRDDMPDDVAVLIDPVPNETVADIETLRSWYRERTGKEPPLVGNENVLLVQLFFEWRVGAPLPQFASRFRNRIHAADPTGAVEEALARILAVNRLYTGACKAAVETSLSAPLRDIVDQLRNENHLADESNSTRVGVWLAHAHLAEAIYSSWFPAPSAHARQEHLKDAALGCLQYGQTPMERTSPLWAISRAIGPAASASDLARRLDERTACAVLGEIYKHSVRDGQTMPIAHLPVWIQLRRWLPNLSLVPDPVSEAIARLGNAGIDETGLRLTCHKLLEHLGGFDSDAREQAISAVLGVLTRNPSWREWVAVADDAVACISDPRLWLIVVDWVQPRIRIQVVQKLFLRALQCAGGEPLLTQLALAELRNADATEEWSQIAGYMLESSTTARAEVLLWLELRYKERGVALLLGRLLTMGTPNSEEWGLAWAKLWHLEANANRVLEPLCVPSATADVFAWSRVWIEQRHQNSGFLMERLVIAVPDDEDVHDLVLRWLQWVPSNDGAWCYVWEATWERTASRESLAALSRDWLGKVSASNGSWGYIWQALWDHQPGGEVLRDLARDWLGKVSADHGSWGYVWQALWDHQPGGEVLRDLARNWLGKVSADHGSWYYVWKVLWEHQSGDEVLRGLACDWLGKVSSSNGSWGYIWQALWEHQSGDEVLRGLACDWLGKAPEEHYSWGFVWLTLWERYLGDSELEELACARLRSPRLKASADWPKAWEFFWEHVQSVELRQIGREWVAGNLSDPRCKFVNMKTLGVNSIGGVSSADGLREFLQISKTDSIWPQLWRNEWQMLPSTSSRDTMQEAGIEWLGLGTSQTHQDWPAVFAPLWYCSEGDSDIRENLQAVGKIWLYEAPLGLPGWPSVWTKVAGAEPRNERLLTVGLDWLARSRWSHSKWQGVWKILWNEDLPPAHRARLIEFAIEWLRRCRNRPNFEAERREIFNALPTEVRESIE